MHTDKQQILKDDMLDARLLESGYVIVPFLNGAEVAALKAHFLDLHQDKLEGIYATAHVDNKDFRVAINDFLQAQYARAVDLYFNDCQALGGSYIVKAPGEYGELSPHQDWNIVDESRFRSFNIWTPLVDVREENGAILVLENSHDKLQNFRGPNIPCAFKAVYPLVWPKMKVLEMKAGEALIYDHRLLHASKQNQSEDLRIATVFGIIPKAAKMKYYYKNGAQMEEYACSPEFYLHKNPFAGPADLELLRSFKDQNAILDQASFLATFEGKRQGFWGKLKAFFVS